MAKQCKKCGEVKAFDDFYAASGTRDGRRGECKVCNLAAKAKRHQRDPTSARDRVATWRVANPERYAKHQQEARESGRKQLSDRRSHLKRKYGLTLEQYDAMLEEQGGVCFLCGRPPTEGISLHVDHDHTTGQSRKLLCFRCNNSLGDLDDDPELLRKAADYLDDHDPEMVELAAITRQRVAALRR